MATKKKLKAKAPAKSAKKAIRKVARKAKKVQPIPAGYHTVTAALVIRGAAEAIEFYRKAFGAKVRGGVMTSPDGKVMHAELKIGDSVVMIGEEFPDMGAPSPQALGGSPTSLMIYTKDSDGLFTRAIDAGAKVAQPLENQFWGDRYGKLEDPFGHIWAIATHVEDVTPREMAKRMQAMFSGPPGQQ